MSDGRVRGSGDGNPGINSELPPLRTRESVVAPHLRVPLTSFIGREAEIDDVRRLLTVSRLVTLSGAGGAGKTRLAVHVAGQMATGFADGACHVDFAPLAHPDLVAVTVARALGLPDQPGRSAADTLLRFVGDRQMLLLLDNCEHLLDASATLVNVLLGACPNVTVLATSREPIGAIEHRSATAGQLAEEAREQFLHRLRAPHQQPMDVAALRHPPCGQLRRRPTCHAPPP